MIHYVRKRSRDRMLFQNQQGFFSSQRGTPANKDGDGWKVSAISNGLNGRTFKINNAPTMVYESGGRLKLSPRTSNVHSGRDKLSSVYRRLHGIDPAGETGTSVIVLQAPPSFGEKSSRRGSLAEDVQWAMRPLQSGSFITPFRGIWKFHALPKPMASRTMEKLTNGY